ncbi:radical SAM protein [Patescibacteria group bacterium]|nr:radical SAM protein [Patescibacteria group bacterium]
MDAPIAIELQITDKCNLRCKHCCQDNYSKIMPMNKIKEILKILYKKNVFEISLVGGELFTHPNIWDILDLCNNYDFAINIITNATLLDNKFIKKLAKFKNIVFLVSLEGVHMVNDKIRGIGVFKKVDKVLQNLKKHNIHVEISTTISKNNINNYQEIIDYSKSLDIPCNFNLFKPFHCSQKNLILDPDKYFNFVQDIFSQRLKNKAKIGLTNAAIVSCLMCEKDRNECRATLSGLTINVDGKMVPCPFLKLAGYYNNNILPTFNKNFLNAWKNNFLFMKFREGNIKECQARSYIFSKNINGLDPYGIQEFKKYLKQINKRA